MPQTTVLANQNKGTLFNGDFASVRLFKKPESSRNNTVNLIAPGISLASYLSTVINQN